MEKIISLAWDFCYCRRKIIRFAKQSFSQNTDFLLFDFCIQQRTRDQYNNLQIPKEQCNLFRVNNKDSRTTSMTPSGIFIVNFEQILHLVLLFVLLRQVNARYGWLLLRHFSCVSFIYLHVQQKQLSSHTKTGGTDGGGSVGCWGQKLDRHESIL